MIPNYSRRRILRTFAYFGTGAALKLNAETAAGEPQWLRPGERGFSDTCLPFNTEVRTKPGLIAKCASAESVATAVKYARENRLPVAVRSGGHSFVGHSLNSDGVVLDLSGLSHQQLVDRGKTYLAGPGVKLKETYEFLLPRGRLLPAGSCGGVGLGGLTLGGGYGLFAREFGLTCDHLEGLTMVNGLGEIVDSRDDPEILWACRGGGNGNFGIAVAFRFKTQTAPENLSAVKFTAVPSSNTEMERIMNDWFAIASALPDPVFSALVLNHKQVTVLMTSPYSPQGPAFQKASAEFVSTGMKTKGASYVPISRALPRYYGRSNPLPFRNFSGGYYRGSNDLASIASLIVHEVRTNPGAIFQVNTLGGAIQSGPDSAYPHRGFPFLGEVQTYWEPGDYARREALLESSERIREAIAGAGITNHYRNYPSLKFDDWREAYYGNGYKRLQKLKKRLDPENVIRHHQSVDV